MAYLEVVGCDFGLSLKEVEGLCWIRGLCGITFHVWFLHGYGSVQGRFIIMTDYQEDGRPT